MGSRYLVTGTQLGELIVLSKINAVKCNMELNRIVEEQQVGNSDCELDDDLKLLRQIFKK